MMIIGIGVDLVEVSRIEKALQQEGFKEKIFTDEEIAYCESKKCHAAESFSGRYAVKEAVGKALGTWALHIYGKGRETMKNRVRELRTEAGMTQQQLADLVHVSSRTIISLEKGQYNPSLLLAYRLALVFRTTVEDLYCLAENKEQEDRENEEWT